jgi:ankyrin repeat protein
MDGRAAPGWATPTLPELADILLRAGASPDVSARGDGGTPLMQALFWGHAAMADTLAEHGVHPFNLRVAAGLGRIDLLEQLFDAEGHLTPQASAHREYYRPHPGFSAWTPSDDPQEISTRLCLCGEMRARAALDFLLQRGANVHAEPYNGTALHWACSTGQVATRRMAARSRRQHSRSVKVRWRVGLKPLHIAAWSGKTEVARLLLNRGADITVRETRYWATPLDWAEFNGRQETRDFL